MLDILYKMGDDALDNEGMIVIEPLPFMTTTEPLQFQNFQLLISLNLL